MNVSVIGLTPGGPDASRAIAHGGQPRGRDSDGTRVEPRFDEVHRQAWFDFNGDGMIDDTSPMYGGDGTLVGYKTPAPDRVREVSDHARSAPAVVVDNVRLTYERYSRPDNRDTPAAT